VIIDGSHRRWCYATLLLFLLSSGGYVVYARCAPGGARGGSVPGLLYGIAGSALMLYAGLIGARKKVPTWRIGSAQTWLRGHIWLGLLSVPLTLFHAGFRWGGLLEQILLLVLAAIVASGLIGLSLQQFLPRQMTARVPLETFYAQLPYECRLLQVEGDVAVAAVGAPLPIVPDREVANATRLKSLGVMEKRDIAKKPKEKDGEKTAAEKEHEKHQRLLASVYRLPDKEPAAAAPQPQGIISPSVESPAAVATAAPASKPDSGNGEEPKKPPSAADKIAMMRAVKRTTPKPAEAVAEPKETPASEAPPSDGAKKPLTAAEKLALMRSAKASKSQPVAAAVAEPKETPVAVASPSDGAKKPLTAAEKIALMRSAKASKSQPAAAAVAEPNETPALEAPPSEDAKKPLSAAEKIALMRAGKGAKPATAPQEAEKVASEQSTSPATSGKLRASDKIALMRANKAKAVAAAPQAAEAGAAVESPKPAAPAKPEPPPKPPSEDPLDAEVRRRGADELARFYVESVRPFLAYHAPRRGALTSEVNAGGVFAAMRLGLPDELHSALDRLAALCDKRRQLSVQERVHRWLHGWLFVHVPLSLALLGLGVVHAVLSLYY
jgi:hypothetical protein